VSVVTFFFLSTLWICDFFFISFRVGFVTFFFSQVSLVTFFFFHLVTCWKWLIFAKNHGFLPRIMDFLEKFLSQSVIFRFDSYVWHLHFRFSRTTWSGTSCKFEKKNSNFFSRVGNSWWKFMKNTSKNAQRRDKSIAATFIVQTHCNEKLSAENHFSPCGRGKSFPSTKKGFWGLFGFGVHSCLTITSDSGECGR